MSKTSSTNGTDEPKVTGPENAGEKSQDNGGGGETSQHNGSTASKEKAVKPAKEKPENNKPKQTTFEDEADAASGAPKVTGQKPGLQKVAGKKTVNLKHVETGFTHDGLPAATAEALIKKNPNQFQVVDGKDSE